MNVLLVDDETTILKMLKQMLRAGGFDVLGATSGAEALELARTQPIDILVTDVVMQDIDGSTLAHSLAKDRPDLPVLFISGQPIDFETERRRFARCAFLRKPFLRGELMKAIADIAPPPA